MKKTPTLFLAALALLTACSESPEAKVKREAAELAALKKKMTVVAQAAADQRLIGNPACIGVTNEGTLYRIEDVDLLPETRVMRFLESEGVAVRQIVDRGDQRDVRFFIKEIYRDNFDTNRYCFGRWAIVDIAPTPKGKAEKRNNVVMYPFDVTMRLTQIPSQTWLESRLVRENLLDGMNSITRDYKIRAVLPTAVNQLPPADSVKKRLDE